MGASGTFFPTVVIGQNFVRAVVHMLDQNPLRLVEIIQSLSLTQSLDEIIAIVGSAAREIAEADGATFVLKENDHCHYVDEDAIEPLFKGGVFPAKFCISGAAMEQKETIVVPDIYQDSRIPIDFYRPTFVKSLCMTPIRARAPIGAIGVYWKEEKLVSPKVALALSALANSCSIAIENVYLQTQLRARLEQGARLSRLKEDFLRSLSYELRTPLNQIMGWVQLLKEDPDSEELAQGLEAIGLSGLRQETIIKNLLDGSSLVSGELKLAAEYFDLGDLIAPLLEDFRVVIESKRLEVKILSASTESYVIADRSRTKDIIWNLFSNAVKFSPSGAQIILDCRHDEDDSIIEIGDEGIGIEEEFLPKVFDLFARAGARHGKNYPGAGLGLSIGKFLAEAQGGSLSLASPGLTKGTLATLRMPTAATRFNRKKKADPIYMSHVFEHLMQSDMASNSRQLH